MLRSLGPLLDQFLVVRVQVALLRDELPLLVVLGALRDPRVPVTVCLAERAQRLTVFVGRESYSSFRALNQSWTLALLRGVRTIVIGTREKRSEPERFS